MNLGEISYDAMVAATLVYLVAAIFHMVEWAAAHGAEPRPRTRRDAEPVLVGVGSGGTLSSSLAHPSADSSSDAPLDHGTGDHGTGGHEAATAAARRERSALLSERAGRSGVALTGIAFAAALFAVVTRGIAAERFPWANMYEFVTASLLFVVGAHLVLVLRKGQRWLGLPVAMLTTLGMMLAVTAFYVEVSGLVPSLQNRAWLIVHIGAAAIAGAAFNVGAIATLLYVVKSRMEKRGTVRGYWAAMPSTRQIDLLAYRAHAFAFPLWTFAIAAGAVWAEYAWGRFWGWDPKETMSLVTWIIYAGYLHARATAGWRGNRAAVIALVGVVAFWFNFVGINLLAEGLHSYAGI